MLGDVPEHSVGVYEKNDEEVLALAEEPAEMEDEIRELMGEGVDPFEAFERYGMF